MTAGRAKFHPPPSHPTRPIDAVRANSAFRAQGLLPRGKYPIVLAGSLADVRGAQEGMLRLAQWDRALLGLLSAPQLRHAMGVVLGRPEPSYPLQSQVAKPFASHAREDGSLPAKSGTSYFRCALPPVLPFMDQCGSSFLSHNSENTLSCIFLPPPPETKGKQDRNMTFMTYLPLEVYQNRSSEMLVSSATVAA
ncbi:hypothetical protein DUI87_09872 [Hirundo rustica rustica]|uniref:Uncharacterized protein n=1 Tax=Hirundo rustica rustica TaxID=333673 RepID=A0A3M0KYZ5_HIRRU|nr:hypothetical protein DUI87_09872 [Hirundo rustica rustica]